jgi:hypothetical protein
MPEFRREAAIERVEEILETVETARLPVPVREVWVYGDLALGLDPVERLDVYLTKDIRMGSDDGAAQLNEEFGIEGIGSTVSAAWAEANPDHLRANANGHAAPEQCLAAQLLDADEPVHLEVCNASFEDNVTQRFRGAKARESYEQILDPRGVCLWVGDGTDHPHDEPTPGSERRGTRSDDALRKLREGELIFPTLAGALEMIGMEEGEAATAADAVAAYRERQEGRSVRGDVV